MTEETRTCTACGETKPMVDFLHAGSGSYTRMCRRCTTSQSYQRSLARAKRVKDRKIYNRAYHRTKARVIEHFQVTNPEWWNRVLAEEQAAAEAEYEELGGANLMPGPKAKHEEVAARIAKECTSCGTHHGLGHMCTVCGSTPDQPMDIIAIAELASGQFSLDPHKTTVLKGTP